MRIHNSSLHLIVKNEVALMPKLLAYVAPWVDEVIVIDTGSTDGTLEVARQFTDVVIQTSLDSDFSTARNLGLSKVSKEWVLHLDADEWPTRFLLNWLATFVSRRMSTLYSGVSIHRHNTVGGEDIGIRTHEWHTRFFRRMYRFEGRIHELINVPGRAVKRAPYGLVIEHFKSAARQERQNVFYQQWVEQRKLVPVVM